MLPVEKFNFRPSVYGIIKNGDEYCICRNKSNGKIWFPGGAVEKGESLKEALLREIEEEAGLKDVQVGQFLGYCENYFYYEPGDEAMQAYLFFFACTTENSRLNTNSEIDDREVTDFTWVSKDEIRTNDISGKGSEIMAMIQSL